VAVSLNILIKYGSRAVRDRPRCVRRSDCDRRVFGNKCVRNFEFSLFVADAPKDGYFCRFHLAEKLLLRCPAAVNRADLFALILLSFRRETVRRACYIDHLALDWCDIGSDSADRRNRNNVSLLLLLLLLGRHFDDFCVFSISTFVQ